MSYTLSEIHPDDHRGMAQVRNLLEQEGIRRDGNLDYTCGIFNDDWELAATGSCFGNTIRCLAVSGRHRGEGLLNQIVSHLVEVQLARAAPTCSSIPSRTAPNTCPTWAFMRSSACPAPWCSWRTGGAALTGTARPCPQSPRRGSPPPAW